MWHQVASLFMAALMLAILYERVVYHVANGNRRDSNPATFLCSVITFTVALFMLKSGFGR